MTGNGSVPVSPNSVLVLPLLLLSCTKAGVGAGGGYGGCWPKNGDTVPPHSLPLLLLLPPLLLAAAIAIAATATAADDVAVVAIFKWGGG